MLIIPRSEWGAVAPEYARFRVMGKATDGWFWHWLGNGYPEQMSDEQILRSVQRFHMQTKGWSDIAYSFAVGRDGAAYELRGWDIAGGHTKGYNSTSMAIVFLIGQGELPTPKMFRTAWAIMAMRPEITQVRTHRSVGQTTCPGNEIAAEVTDRKYKDAPMPIEEANAHVERTYQAYLGRPSDPGGLKYWSDRLVAGMSVYDLRWAFLEVRLAADKAAQSAVLANPSGIEPAVVAEQAYRLFLDGLVALQSSR